MGLVVNIVELQDKLVKTLSGVTTALGSTCRAWDAWTKKNKVIDVHSGL